jgi:hypothetical protein
MRLEKNGCNCDEIKSFELSENLLEKSNILSFFEKIAIEVECILQNFTKNHEICEA